MEATGDCYVVAGNLVTGFGEVPEGAVLCHGTAVGQEQIEGIEFGHAWVEYLCPATGMPVVIDKANGNDLTLPAVVYYKVGEIRDVTRYKPQEARAMMLKHKHYGPWED